MTEDNEQPGPAGDGSPGSNGRRLYATAPPESMASIIFRDATRIQEARAEATEVLRINPNFSVDSFIKIPPYRNQSAIDNIADTLRKAGLK